MVYYLKSWWVRNLGAVLAGQLWLRVSWGHSHNVRAKVTVIWRPNWSWWVRSQWLTDMSFGRMPHFLPDIGERLQFLIQWAFHGATRDMAIGFSQSKWCERARARSKPPMPLMTWSQKSHTITSALSPPASY